MICWRVGVSVVTPAEMFDCSAMTTTTHPTAASAAVSVPSLYVLGPAAFDPLDDDALSCPLVINAADGQHINLTLYDFGVTSRHDHAVTDYSGYDQVRVLGNRSIDAAYQFKNQVHELSGYWIKWVDTTRLKFLNHGKKLFNRPS